MLTTVSGFVDKYGTNATSGGQLIVGAVAISAILGHAAYIALQLPEIASGLAGWRRRPSAVGSIFGAEVVWNPRPSSRASPSGR